MDEFEGMDLDLLREMNLKYMLYAARDMIDNIRPLAGLVYVVYGSGDYDDLCKIGRTKNIVSRLPSLESYYGCKLSLISVIWTEDPPLLEKYFHSAFSDKRTQTPKGTEWFRLSAQDRMWLREFEAVSTEWIEHLQKSQARLHLHEQLIAIGCV